MQKYLNMVSFSPTPTPDTTFATAKPCSINQDCLDEQGLQKPIKGNMYVDDSAPTGCTLSHD
jgi:hypothetical protein